MHGLKRALAAMIAAGLLAPTAGASIVYRDIPDIHAVELGPSGAVDHFLDLDADGTDDFQFRLAWNYFHGTSTDTWLYTLHVPPGVVYRSGSAAGAEVLPEGFVIQAVLPAPPPNDVRSWNSSVALASNIFGVTGGWWNGAGYVGVRFAEADGNHYGWIAISATTTSLDIYSFAYETTPDGPIAAGAVPAPGSAALLVGGLASAGLRRRRR